MAGFLGLSARKWALASVGALGVTALVIWGLGRQAPQSDVVAALPELEETAPAESAATEATEAGVPEEIAPEKPGSAEPSFDLVRIDPDGSALIAGRAHPEENIDVLLDDVPVAMSQADQSGAFVTLTSIGASDKPRVLALSTLRDGKPIRSSQTVIVAPSAPSAVRASTTPPAGVTPEQDETTLALEDTSPVETAPSIDGAGSAPEVQSGADELPSQPTVLVADEEGVRVLQSSGPPAAVDRLSIDTITYDSDGDVILGGRADTAATSVQIYLDNRPLATAPMTDGGDWRAALPTLEPQVYTLRVDALDAQGRVTSRAETPFRPENPADVEELVAEADSDPATGVSLVTVQPGNSLWRIASDIYGEGLLYVRVFEANADKIRDPDLIYPGQIFTLPEDKPATQP